MKYRIQLVLVLIFPSFLFSETIIGIEEDEYLESERIEEISESLTMIVSPEFQEAVFESVETESGRAYGGSITSFLNVVYHPYSGTLIAEGREDFPEAFERAFAEVFMQARLNASIEEIIQAAESIRGEVIRLNERKASESLNAEEEEILDAEISDREGQIADLLSSLNGRRSMWSVLKSPEIGRISET